MPTKYGGYMGKVMLLDLTEQTIREYPWSDEERQLYIGGKTMAARILCDLFSGDEEPLSADNVIVVSTGPLTGTGAPSSSRFNISTLSPQTGFLTSSNCGGTFGYYLKKAGMDALIIRGSSDQPTWIEIDGDKIRLHSAHSMWGMKVTPCQRALSDRLSEEYGFNKKFGSLVIGPAGENRVRYAGVASGERAAGRTGVGAVFGAKQIKAITAAGHQDITVHNPKKAKKFLKKWFKYLKKHPLTGKQLPRLGTAGLVSSMQMRGMLSTRNYSKGQYEDFDKVNGETLAEQFNITNKGCMTCPIKCARTVRINDEFVKGPELETLGLLGGGIENNDLQKILEWNHELDELGMDTISTANTISWAMEANEKDIWKSGLNFGETDRLSEVFEDIAHRRGIGDLLAEGSKRLSELFGGEEFAIHAKGLELAAYEPRRAVGMGLGYAVANRGGCHLNGGYLVIVEGLGLNTNPTTPKAKADFTMVFQDLMEMIAASGQCVFTSYGFFPGFLITRPNGLITRIVNAAIPHIGWALRLINKHPLALHIQLPVFPQSKFFEIATGIPMSFGNFKRCGERGYTLERYVNTRFGVSEKDDKLPKRLTDIPQDEHDPKSKVPLEKMKKTYYKARGWNSRGIPTRDTLQKLKIIN